MGEYKGYQIEEEKPGKFYIYSSREDWLQSIEPLDIRPTLEDAQRYVDLKFRYGKQEPASSETGKELETEREYRKKLGGRNSESIMYHATLLENWDKISEVGLSPQILPHALTRETGLSRGLYVGSLSFVRGYAEGEAESMFDLGEAEPPIDMAVLKIRVPENVCLVRDLNFPEAEAYVIDARIPPSDIELVEVVRFSPKSG